MLKMFFLFLSSFILLPINGGGGTVGDILLQDGNEQILKENWETSVVEASTTIVSILKKMYFRVGHGPGDHSLYDSLAQKKHGQVKLNNEELIRLLNKCTIVIKRKGSVYNKKVLQLKVGDNPERDYGNCQVSMVEDKKGDNQLNNFLEARNHLHILTELASELWSVHPASLAKIFKCEDGKCKNQSEWDSVRMREKFLHAKVIDVIKNEKDEALSSTDKKLIIRLIKQIFVAEGRLSSVPAFALTPKDLIKMQTPRENIVWPYFHSMGIQMGLNQDNFHLNIADDLFLPSLLGNRHSQRVSYSSALEVARGKRKYKIVKYNNEENVSARKRNAFLVEITSIKTNVDSEFNFFGRSLDQEGRYNVGFGTGAKGEFQHNIVYRTYIPINDEVYNFRAKTELELKKYWPAIYAKAMEKDIPLLLEDMEEEDEIIFRLSGQLKAKLLLGAHFSSKMIPYVSKLKSYSQGNVLGEYDVAIKKLPNYKVEVAIIPNVVAQVGSSFDILSYLEMDADASLTVMRKQVFVFDLKHQVVYDDGSVFYPARKALARLFYRRELPLQDITSFEVNSFLEVAKASIPGVDSTFIDGAGNTLIDAVQSKNRALREQYNGQGSGVELTFMETVDVGHAHFRHYMQLPGSSMAKGFLPAGKSTHKVDFRMGKGFYRHSATNGRVATVERSYGFKRDFFAHYSPHIESGVYATIHYVYGWNPNDGSIHTVDYVTVNAEINDPLVSYGEEARLVQDLQHFFPGLYLGRPRMGSELQNRTLHLQLKLTEQDFAKIETCSLDTLGLTKQRLVLSEDKSRLEKGLSYLMHGLVGGRHTIDLSESWLGSVHRKAGVKGATYQNLTEDHIDSFVARLRMERDTEIKAKIVAEYVDDYGLKAFSMIYMLLGAMEENSYQGPMKLLLRSESDYYQIIKEAENFLFNYTDYEQNQKNGYRLGAHSKATEIQEMYNWGELIKKDLKLKLRQLYFDPFLLDERNNELKKNLPVKVYQYILKNGLRETKEDRRLKLAEMLRRIEDFLDYGAKDKHLLQKDKTGKWTGKVGADDELFKLFRKAYSDNVVYDYYKDAVPAVNPDVLQEYRDKLVNFDHLKLQDYLVWKKPQIVTLDIPQRFLLLAHEVQHPLRATLDHENVKKIADDLYYILLFKQSLRDEMEAEWPEFWKGKSEIPYDDNLDESAKDADAHVVMYMMAPQYYKHRVHMIKRYQFLADSLVDLRYFKSDVIISALIKRLNEYARFEAKLNKLIPYADDTQFKFVARYLRNIAEKRYGFFNQAEIDQVVNESTLSRK